MHTRARLLWSTIPALQNPLQSLVHSCLPDDREKGDIQRLERRDGEHKITGKAYTSGRYLTGTRHYVVRLDFITPSITRMQ
jgi:hypothetical protein